MEDIISQLKKQDLLGRSGSGFPVGLKWESVKDIKAEKKYIVCNGSEGEPGVEKDGFILDNFSEEIIMGIKIALETIDNSSAYIYLRKDYYQRHKQRLEKIIGKFPIKLFKKQGGYLAGEETAICEAIEGKRPESRIKPPFPSEKGLWGYPTLINNVETFYQVAQIAEGKYNKTRFYSISGDSPSRGVYELPENFTIKMVLQGTGNVPKFDFFVQAGGGAVGEILTSCELERKIRGIGSIIIYNRAKTDPFVLLKKWTDFFLAENCDRCTPCREGVYRIAEMVDKREMNKKILDDLFFALEKTSLCSLGKFLTIPYKSLINKILNG